MNLSPEGPSWWRWVVRMIVKHERRITRLEGEQNDDMEVTGFWSWANAATSGSQKLVATATLLIIVVILVLVLATSDVTLDIPFISTDVPIFAATGEGSRLLRQLVGPDDIQHPDGGEAEEDDHERTRQLPA